MRISILELLIFISMGSVLCAQEKPAFAPNPFFIQSLQPSEDELLSQAIDRQQQKAYPAAVQLFVDLLRFYPNGKHTETALYRLAECYRALGRFEDAQETVQLCRKRFPKGEWLEAGFLLQAEMFSADGQWEDALVPLEEITGSAETKIRARALYLAVLAYENLGRVDKTKKPLETLAAFENEWRNFARLRLGVLLTEAGELPQAEALFRAVLQSSKDSKDDPLRAEAAVRLGNLLYEQERYAEAKPAFQFVKAKAPEAWRQLANLGLIRADFSLKDYFGVVAVFNERRPVFPEKTRAQVFFLVAEAYRLSGQKDKALTQYELIIQEFPKSDIASAGAWARLLLLNEDPRDRSQLLDETAAFLAKFTDSDRLPFVRLMRADAFFLEGKFAQSAKMYSELVKNGDLETFEPAVQTAVYYRWGHSAFAEKNYEDAEKALETFLQRADDKMQTASAFWMLAQSRLAQEHRADAQRALEQLLSQHADFPERETAFWQSALLALEEKNDSQAQGKLLALLKEFPQSERSAEAHQLLALSFLETGDLEKSAFHWKRARELNPAVYTETATQQLIRIALENQNLRALIDEVAHYDAWRGEHPSAPPVAVEVLEWMAHELSREPIPVRAEAYYRRVLKRSEDSEQRRRAQLGLAMLLSDLKDWQGAVREWKVYRVNFPQFANQSAVLEALAKALIHTQAFDEAGKLAEQILKQNPEGEFNARARLLLGEIEFAQGNYAEAQKIFSAVALLIDDPVLTPHARARSAEAKMLIGR